MKHTLRRRGASMLESVLVLIVFLSILIGSLDLGQVLFFHQALVERARNAVRYGAVRTYNATEITNMVLYNQPTAPTGRTTGDFGLTTSHVTVTRQSASTNDDRIVVTIANYRFRFFSPLIAKIATAKPIMASMPYEL